MNKDKIAGCGRVKAMTKLQLWWKRKLEEAYKSGEYSEDQFGELKDKMTDELDYHECEEVLVSLDI
jgi:hypothetical protein